MREVNRSAVVLTPKQPFLDWLHSVDLTSSALTLDDLAREPTVYLVGECESHEDFVDQLRQFAPAMFEDELDGWWQDRSVWPTSRAFDTLLQWFHCEFHSMVFDFLDGGPSAVRQ